MSDQLRSNQFAPRVAAIAWTLLAALLSPPGARAEDAGLLARAEHTAHERGAGDPRVAELMGKLQPAQHEVLALVLAPRQCVVSAAALDAESADLELSVRTPENLTLVDSGSGPLAFLRYCAGVGEEKLQVRVKASAATGFAVGVWPVRAGAARAAPPPPKPAPEAPAPPTTAAGRLAELAQAVAPAMEAMTPPRDEALKEGGRPLRRDIALEQERCYRVLAVVEAPLSNVDLSLSDATGVSLASEKSGETTAVLAESGPICPKTTGIYALTLTSSGGSGKVLWQLFGAPNPAFDARWAIGGDSEILVAKRVRQLHAQHAASKVPAMPFQTGELKTAGEAVASFDVLAGRCYAALGAGVPSVRSLELDLIDQRGNVVAHAADQGNTGRAGACADLNARWSVRLRVFKGYGAYGLQVFSGQ